MAMARMTSVGGESSGSAEETFKAVLVSAMAGSRAMAIIAGGDDDDDASTVASTVGSRMEGAGAKVMSATARPGATLMDLIDQVAAPMTGGGKDAGRGKDTGKGKDRGRGGAPDGATALALQLLQGEDAGFLAISQAHLLDPRTLENLLSLSQVEPGDGRVLQVLLSGNAALNKLLDHSTSGGAQQVGVLRWFLGPQPQAAVQTAASEQGAPPSRPTRPARPVIPPPRPTPRMTASAPVRKPSLAGLVRFLPTRLVSRIGAIALLFIAAASAGWFIAGLFRTETTIATVEAPAAPHPSPAIQAATTKPATTQPAAVQPAAIQPPSSETPASQPPASDGLTPTADLMISTDHGPRPTMHSGETVVVRLETTADKFVYCYYMDGLGQVSRIFPNRFQSDAFVPAGEPVEIPPGPERPFNIRLDTPGRIEFVACLSSPIEVQSSRIAGADADDLTSIPGLRLNDLLHDFAALASTGARGQTMPISVIESAEGSPPQTPPQTYENPLTQRSR
jgi:hypothetical protein